MTEALRAGRGRPRKGSTAKTLANFGITSQQISEWGRMATVCDQFENDALFELLLSLRKPNGRMASDAARRRALRMAEGLLNAGFSQDETLEIVRTTGGGPSPKKPARKCPNCGVFIND